jgi:ParB-like chromosome segregation protein Spo0J
MEQQLKTLPLSEIIDHPQNAAIYGDEPGDDLVQSIRENGVINPVVVFYDSYLLCFVCLSGHRRRAAAAAAGLTDVPAIMLADDLPDWQQIIWIIEANRQRQKTAKQVANETRELLAAKKIEAEHRMKAGKKSEADPAQPVAQGRKRAATAIEEAAAVTGVGSRPTAERAVKASAKAKELRDAGQEEKAQQIEEAMEKKGFKAAAALADVIDKEPEPEETQEAIVDEYGVPVPEMLRQVWSDAKELEQLMRDISKIRSRIEELAAKPHGRWIDRQHAETLCQDLRSAIKFALPHVECGQCRRDEQKRKSCKLCRARGFVTEQVHKNSTREAKAWIDQRSTK